MSTPKKKKIKVDYDIVKQPNVIPYKFKLGQEVFIIYKMKVKRQRVFQVRVTMDETGLAIQYIFELPDPTIKNGPAQPYACMEEDVFETQSDLVNHILSQ